MDNWSAGNQIDHTDCPVCERAMFLELLKASMIAALVAENVALRRREVV